MKTRFFLATCYIFFNLFTAISASFTSTAGPTSQCIIADCGKVDLIRTDECIDNQNPGGTCGPNVAVMCSSLMTCNGTTYTTKFYSQKQCIGTPYDNNVSPLNICQRDGTFFNIVGNCVAGNAKVSASSSSQAQISIMLQFLTVGIAVTSMCNWY